MAVKVPAYVSANAERGLKLYEDGKAGDGLVEKTIREARDMVEGEVSEDKVARMGPWLRRHEADLEAPKNSDPDDPEYPGPGLVAWLLWGGDADGNMRTAEWAEQTTARLEEAKRKPSSVDKLGKKKKRMTLEQLNASLVSELETIKLEASGNVNKLAEAEKLLAEVTSKLNEFETLKAEHANALSSLQDALVKIANLEATAAPATAQAAAIVAACSADPATISPDVVIASEKEDDVVAQWKALPEGSKERAAFFKANKQAIFSGLRSFSL